MTLHFCYQNSFLSIPWIAGFVGYLTNVVALEVGRSVAEHVAQKVVARMFNRMVVNTNLCLVWSFVQMTFWPLEFFGIELVRFGDEPYGLFGWQGIIPSKARKMATVTFELMTSKLFNLRDVFSRLDPVRFGEVMEDAILLMMDDVIKTVAMEFMPTTWQSLPKEVQDDIVVTANQEAKEFMTDFMKDMIEHIDDVCDVKHLCVETVVKNKHLMVKIFQECGEEEFIFIRRSGFYFGFLFGVFQLGLVFFYNENWVLPVAGFIVGWFTNYLALKFIFEPREPIRFGNFSFQGSFLKRQPEVSAVFARVVMAEILHVKALWEAVFVGPLSANFFAMLRAHTLVFTDKLVAEVRPLVLAALGAERFAQMKEAVAQKVVERIPTIIDHSYAYTQEALDMENLVREKMKELTPEEFEGVLHPAFEEDEIELIALGGVLGAIVGVGQIYMMGGGPCAAS